MACNPGMCPDWELNLRHFGSQPTLNPLSYASQGLRSIFLKAAAFKVPERFEFRVLSSCYFNPDNSVQCNPFQFTQLLNGFLRFMTILASPPVNDLFDGIILFYFIFGWVDIMGNLGTYGKECLALYHKTKKLKSSEFLCVWWGIPSWVKICIEYDLFN
ncbi:hypothetical protein HJG60_010085 [Phyllostomus discolor]|uniref:Uncharacterized protein n=1 Tax=Phyllostomus discolor TaxID=89673 RepID=A0A834EJY3_9CHIR|nr:hypothetical protein HJG60_010085 [Phyllostomus discolor]